VAALDRTLAKELTDRFWMADRELYRAFELIYQRLGEEGEKELQRRILEIMRTIQTDLVHRLYDRYPDLRPVK
jgi:hypothetical protein